MLIAIISDVHNNTVNLKKILDYCAKNSVEKIICCGDLASAETLDFLNDNFTGKIFYCFGNMDNDQLKNYEFAKKYKNTVIYQEIGKIKIDNKRVAFTHYPEIAKKLCQTGEYDFVFYGHTHKPWEEVINNCKMLNPGNVAGEIYPPTFAMWNAENDYFELIEVHRIN